MSVATGPPAAFRLRVRTPRLLLRPWRPGDGRAAKQAIDASLEHLRPWMPWARREPSPVEVVEARLAAFRLSFMNGLDWVCGIFPHDQSRVLGGAGLHTRQGPGILEVGYWVRADAVRQGFATEAAAALLRCAVERHGIAKIEIRCDPGNTTRAVIVGEAMVGYISCFPMDGQDHVGYWIDRAYWGMGIASRALHLLLREVAKRPLVATAATSNVASLRVLQKCGFIIEQVRLSPASERYPECEETVLVLR